MTGKSALNSPVEISDEHPDASCEAECPPSPPGQTSSTSADRRLREPRRLVALAAMILVIAAAVFGYLKYRHAVDDLATLRQANRDTTTAAQTASDYATKSLTYSFEDPDAFFQAVEQGVSGPLKDKFVNAAPLLKGIMLQAQVTSTGEVLATDVAAQPGNIYQVVVSAAQSTRNLQNPQLQMSVILLQITVTKVGDTWQVSDIGPKTGTPPVTGALPAPPPPLAPAPAPGKPR